MSRIASNGAVVLAAFVVACAGGRGGDSGGCPAGSVLTIFPTTARVTAGGPAVSLGGGVTNCAEDIRWSLSGPGSLDRNRGVPVLYTPPASVSTATTATVTATVGGLSASATITIDPAALLLAGKVIAPSGAPVEGAVVWVGAASATSDAAGGFSLPGVAPPYDIAAVAPGGLLTSYYPGLRRMDPTLVIFDLDPGFPRGGLGSGALSGGAGFPGPTGHEAGVSFESAEATGTCPVQGGSSMFLLGAWWSGPSTVTGELHALQWLADADGRPVSYDGYGNRTGVTLVDHSSVTGQDITLAAVGAKSLAGTIVNPPTSNSASISLFAVVGNGARIRILPPPSDPSDFPSLGFLSTFSVPTPAVPGATIDLVARQDYSGMAYQEVHRHGLAPDATGVAVEFAGLPIQNTPLVGSTVGPGTTFSWYSMPDNPVYVVSFRGPTGSPGYDVFTTAQSLTIPPGFALPSGAAYTWRVRGSSAFSTVEEAAGPGGFLAPAPVYRIAQSSTWPFTTAP
jgi:hypothetical protein